MAELYLEQAGGDLEIAVERFREDERWERENPMVKGKGRSKKRFGMGLSGQLT